MTLAGVGGALNYYLVMYRRSWKATALSSFAMPMLRVLGFGVGVGSIVRQGFDGLSYRDYIIPGLLCSAVIFIAVGDSSWPVMSGFQWNRNYFAQAATPLTAVEILSGHLAFVALRTVLSSLSFLLVAAPLGAIHSYWVLTVPLLVVLISLSFAAPITAFSGFVTHSGSLSLVGRLWVTPMTLFTGVFFPITFLHGQWRWLAYLSPLWHAVDLCRAAMTGVAPDWSVAGHLMYLTAWFLVGSLVAGRVFRRRLQS